MIRTAATTAHTALTRHPTAARRARIWTRAVLCGWDIPGAAADDIELVMSELVSNSVLHASGRIRVHLGLLRGGVRIEVHDAGPAPIRRLRPDRATAGRGLAITSTLATKCGWDSTPGRATAWAHLAVPPADPA